MKKFNELESMTFYKERLYLPYDERHKTKGFMFYVVNTTTKSLIKLYNNEHEKLSNNGNLYHTYYYDYRAMPRAIISNRVRASATTLATAKRQRLANYSALSGEVNGVKTPVKLNDSRYNLIYDLNPLIDLMKNQPKVRCIPIREFIKTYFDTLNNAMTNKSIEDYSQGGLYVDLDDYSSVEPKYHLLTNILLLLKRPESFISTISTNMKITFYSKEGYFVFDTSKDMVKSNYALLNRIIKRLKVNINPESDVDTIEKAEIQRVLAAKASSMHFDGGEEEGIIPDDIIDADSDIVADVSDKIESIDDLEDIEKASQIDRELSEDEVLKLEFQEALKTKSTGKKKTEASTKRDAMLKEQQKQIKIKSKTLDEISRSKATAPIKQHKVEIDSVTNENLKEMKFPEFNKTYMEETYQVDVGNMINALSQDKSIPVYITNVKVEDTSDEFTLKETYTVSLEDENRRRHTLKFSLPKVVDGEFIVVNGSKKTIQNQLMTYPVIKTGPDDVYVCTNYQKVRLQRVGNKFSASSEKFKKLMAEYENDFQIQKGCNTIINKDHLTCLEYDEFAKTYNIIKVGDASFDFNQPRLHDKFPDYKDELGKYLVGYTKKNEPIIFDSKSTEYPDFVGLMVSHSNKDEMVQSYKSYSSGKKFTYTLATLMAKHIPLVVVITYFEGIDTVIRKFNSLNGDVVRFKDKQENKEFCNYIKFKDGFIEYPKSNMEACMLFNGFQTFGTSTYTIEEMNDRSTYLDIFNVLVRGGGYGIADALLNYYDWMIDPITYEILELLDYPTDLVSLLIYANNLLADSQFTSDIDVNMYRIRSMEVISAILYKNIARSYSRYRRTANNPNPAKISMDEDAVIKELVALPTVEDYSELSPMVEVHKQGLVSMKGANGMNLDRAYKLDKRAYHDSMVGIIGISTDNGPNCGKIKQLVAEPTIINTRGFMDVKGRENVKDLKDVNLSTPLEMLTPMTSTHDEPARTLMTTKQTCHVIPVANGCPGLISTGMDQMIHYRTGDDFSVVARQNGKVLTIDSTTNKMIVEYKDGSKQAIDLSPKVVKNGGGGFYELNQLVPNVKVGATFKKDDILAHDPKYYKDQGKYFGNRLHMGSLQKVAVMSNYATYEDSNMVSKKMSRDMASDITMPHKIILGSNSNVDYIVKVGDNITIGDDLIRYETSYDDAELNKMLSNVRDDMKEEIINLGKSQLHSHYTGVVSDIQIISTVDKSELSPSLKKIVNEYQSNVKKQKALLDKYDPSTKGQSTRMGVTINKADDVVSTDEYGKIQGEYVGKGVRIIFYVTYHDELSDGDKLAAWTANKNTIGYVIPENFEPYSEFRPHEEISSLLAPSAILQRGTPSVVTTACAYKVLIELKRKMYKVLTGEDFDRILIQKQPHMIYEPKPTKESLNETPQLSVSLEDIALLEDINYLYKDALGKYRSNKTYLDGDSIFMIPNNNVDYSGMLENFDIRNDEYNAILNDDRIVAIRDIQPNEKLIVKF